MDLSKRNSSVPLLSFYFLFLLFLFFCGLNDSFYLSLICPLGIFCFVVFWDLCFSPLWDLFLTLWETLKDKDTGHSPKLGTSQGGAITRGDLLLILVVGVEHVFPGEALPL